MYAVYTMKRKQIYLDEDQEAAIKRLAAERGVSEAYVIREAMAEYLREHRAEHDRNPLLDLLGTIDDDQLPPDASTTYKRDLYGERSPQP